MITVAHSGKQPPETPGSVPSQFFTAIFLEESAAPVTFIPSRVWESA
jgi:hypothetical protein